MKIDYEKLHNHALGDARGLIKILFPNAKQRGAEWVVGSLDGEPGHSLSINEKTGIWCDFATGDSGGDFVSLYAKKMGMAMPQAAADIARIVGFSLGEQNPKSSGKKKSEEQPQDVLTPVPDGAPHHPTSYRKLEDGHWVEYTFVKSWPYRDRYGNVAGYVARFNPPENRPELRKQILPYRWIDGRWVAKPAPEPRLLYNLDNLYRNPTHTVAIGEGEKTADALAQLLPGNKYVATTWQGGSNAWRKTDWSVLRGRERVLLFPDNDMAGFKCMCDIARHLISEHGFNRPGSIVVVTAHDANPKLPEKWDAADALAEGWKPDVYFAWAKGQAKRAEAIPEITQQPVSVDPQPEAQQKGHSTKHTPSEGGGIDVDDNQYFMPLGYQGRTFFFYNKHSGQINEFSGAGAIKANKNELAPESFWMELAGGHDKTCTDLLIRACFRRDYFDPSIIRGRGAWLEDDKPVLHTGDRLIVDGKTVPTRNHNSRNIYVLRPRLNIKQAEPMPDGKGKALVDICERLRWAEPISAKLFAGWIFAAPICGAMPWRSHLYVSGPSGSGKTFALDNIAGKYLSNVAVKVASKSTGPGVRNLLASDALPVLFDEFEGEDENNRKRLQDVLDIARQSSSNSESVIAFGTQGNGSISFAMRSAFLFASIVPSVQHQADENRMSILRLMSREHMSEAEKAVDAERFAQTRKMVADILTDDFRSAMIARAVKLLPVIVKNFYTFAEAGEFIFGGRRHSDQVAMMLAGCYAITHSDIITKQQAESWLGKMPFGEVREAKIEQAERRLLSALMQSEIRFDMMGNVKNMTIGEMVVLCRRTPDDHFAPDDLKSDYMDKNVKYVRQALRRCGIVVNYGSKEIIFSNTHHKLREILKDTPFALKWNKIFLNIPGSYAVQKAISFGSNMDKAYGTSVPFSFIEKEDLDS